MIAVIADVHANLQAFTAVVEDAERRGATEYWSLGDWVDYGANPNEVLALAQSLNLTRAVGGNHDIALFTDAVAASVTPHGQAAHAYTAARLEPAHAAWLEPLSRRRLCPAAADGIALVHGSPADPYWGRVRPDDDPGRLAAAFAGFDGDVVLVGHSHLQFCLEAGGRRIYNPGSVGQPRNRCPRAQYMLFDGKEFSFRQVAYDVASAAAAIHAAGLPEYLSERLFEGK